MSKHACGSVCESADKFLIKIMNKICEVSADAKAIPLYCKERLLCYYGRQCKHRISFPSLSNNINL